MPAFGLRSLPNLSSLFPIQLRTHVPDPGPECLRYLGVGPWLCFLGTWPWSVALPLLLLLLPHMMGRRVTHIMERRITRNGKCLRENETLPRLSMPGGVSVHRLAQPRTKWKMPTGTRMSYLDGPYQKGNLYTSWLGLTQNRKRPLEQE